MAFGTRPTVIRGDQEGPQRLGRGSGILSAKRGGQSPRGGALQRGGLRGADDGRNLDEVPKRHRAGAKARLILLALSARLKSCPDKKQDGGWKDPMADGLALWSPPHRAKDARWMGHPKFSSLVGRLRRWETKQKQDGRRKVPMADGWPLWSPTHRAKDARWMGHGAFVGRP